MAKVRNLANTLRKGRIGENSWYVRNGEQIVRQSRNNSNYGEEARRTVAQQDRRARWGNLVNFYKACRFWMPKAFETKASNQSDYNKFMQLNVNSTPVYLTKGQAELGGAVVAGYVIAQGSLPSIVVGDVGEEPFPGNVGTNIEVDIEILPSTTVGQLSQSIIANNRDFREGDNIAVVFFEQFQDDNVPRLRVQYHELTLDSLSQERLQGLKYSFIMDGDYRLAFSSMSGTVEDTSGVAVIHTRVDGGKLLVSSASITMRQAIPTDYTSDTARAAAIASYGLDGDVPLAPGE